MSILVNDIKNLAASIEKEVVKNRRHIHANPELSFHEYETCAYVSSQLTQMGIEHTAGFAETGVVGMIRGSEPGPVIALRADMDALPIFEKNEVEYKSTKPGIMHACGHDVHTASLLGTAFILNQVKDKLKGSVKLIFQPGEEKTPGGASIMIKKGVLENPKPNKIIGQHVMPMLPAGTIGFRSGLYMASADELYITVKGKGGHGAMPDFCIDPVLISAHIIVALQQVVSRIANPKIPSVLTIGKVEALGATNVIPNEVKLEGTFRTLDENWRYEAHKRMLKIATGIAESMGGICEFHIDVGYPFLKNDEVLTATARQNAETYVGKDNVVDLDIWMAAEDFSYYTQEMPGCFYRLGTGNKERGITSGVHTPTFDIDESALGISTGLMAWLAIKELENA